MTLEQKHIFEYLKDILTKEWNNLSDYAKENPDTNKPYKNVKQLIKEIESNVDSLNWYFTECLRCHIQNKDLLEKLLVFEANDFDVYEVNGKYIKLWWEDGNSYYQFVERKDFDTNFVIEELQSTIDKLVKENQELKLKLKQYEN